LRDADFEEEALRHLPAMWNVALRLVRDPAQAEDIVQDAYLRAFTRRKDLRRLDACQAWLRAITRSIALNWLKKNARRRQLVVIDGEDVLADGLDGLPGGNLEREILAALLPDDIERALSELPEPFAETVRLRDICELSYEEIAELQGVPAGTVRSRLARGRRRIARCLQAASTGSRRKLDREEDR